MGVLTRIRKQEKKAPIRQNTILKVVHPRGYVEVFREPITAGEIMRRHPRHCIARPDVFEFPWIVVRPESVLVPGKVFYLVPYRTIHNLIKAKREQLQSLKNNYENHNRQNPPIKALAGVTPKHLEQDRCYRGQPHHQSNNNVIVNDQGYSGCNGTKGQDSDSRSVHKLSFYESWNKMRRSLLESHEEGFDQLDSVWTTHSASPDDIELQGLKSCLRKEDSPRKKFNLKVRFSSPVIIPASWRGSPSDQKNGIVLRV